MANLTPQDVLKAVKTLTDAVIAITYRLDHKAVAGMEDVIRDLKALREFVEDLQHETTKM